MDILDISVVRGGQMVSLKALTAGLVIGFGDKEIRFRSFVVTSGDVILFVKGLDPFILLVGLRVELPLFAACESRSHGYRSRGLCCLWRTLVRAVSRNSRRGH